MGKLEKVVIAFILLFVFYTSKLCYLSITTDKECIDMGYERSKITYDLSGYCIRVEKDYTREIIKIK